MCPLRKFVNKSGGHVSLEDRVRRSLFRPMRLSSFHSVWCFPLLGRVLPEERGEQATVAGSSIRSGSPCRARERRASSAPALRMAARSSALRATVAARLSSGRVVWHHRLRVVTVRDRPSRPDFRVCSPTRAGARRADGRTSVTVRGHRGGRAARQWPRMVWITRPASASWRSRS